MLSLGFQLAIIVAFECYSNPNLFSWCIKNITARFRGFLFHLWIFNDFLMDLEFFFDWLCNFLESVPFKRLGPISSADMICLKHFQNLIL